MKKAMLLAACGLIGFAMPAFAETAEDQVQDIRNDNAAVQKDNTAIQHDNGNLAANRNAKANDKATNKPVGQAVDSVKIGANKAALSEKKTEKNIDKSTLQHDINKSNDT